MEANIENMKSISVNLSVGADRINLRMDIDGRVYDKEIIVPVHGEQKMLAPQINFVGGGAGK